MYVCVYVCVPCKGRLARYTVFASDKSLGNLDKGIVDLALTEFVGKMRSGLGWAGLGVGGWSFDGSKCSGID